MDTVNQDRPGQGTPLLLLPGTLCDSRLFDPLLARLSPRPTIVGELFGATTTAALADRILAGAPPRFALLGFSLGAIVALEIAARAPARLAGLALVGGNAHALSLSERTARRLTVPRVTSIREHAETILWPSYVLRPDDRALCRTVVDMAASCPQDAFATQLEVAVSRADSRRRLPAIDVPTLVMAGACDGINPPSLQRAMADAIPGATLELIPAAGHFVLLEQPDASADAIERWLAEVDGADGARHTSQLEPCQEIT